MTIKIENMSMGQELHFINAKIQAVHEKTFPTLDEKRKRLSELYAQAMQLRHRIDTTDPSIWEDAPIPFSIPNQPLEWFTAAVRSASNRNHRRNFIASRMKELKKQTRPNRAELAEARKLIAEAKELGPFEPTGRLDALGTNYLKLLAWSMREDAESKARADQVCVGCGNLAAPSSLFCHQCERHEDDEAMQHLKDAEAEREDAKEERDALRQEAFENLKVQLEGTDRKITSDMLHAEMERLEKNDDPEMVEYSDAVNYEFSHIG